MWNKIVQYEYINVNRSFVFTSLTCDIIVKHRKFKLVKLKCKHFMCSSCHQCVESDPICHAMIYYSSESGNCSRHINRERNEVVVT